MGDTPTPGFPGGTERSVTYGTDQQDSREEEEGPRPAGGGTAVNSSARSLPLVRGPAQSGAVMSGGRLPRGAGRPRNGRGPQYVGQVGEGVPRPGGSGLAVEADTSEPSAAESGPGGEDESRRPQAAPSRRGDPEDQPVPAARTVSAGEPRNGAPHLTRAPAPQDTSSQTPA